MSSTPTAQRVLMRLAWPAVVENLSATMVIMIDSAMVGSLGAAATAAVAVNASPSWLIGGLAASLGVGATALVSRMIGAGDQAGAQRAGRQALLLSLMLSTVLMVLALLCAPLIPRWMGADPLIHADAASYLRIIGLAFIPNQLGMMAGALLRGAGDTRSPMRAALLNHLINITGNFLLIYPTRAVSLLGLTFTMPGAGMGVQGAAIATGIANAVAGLYLVRLLLTGRGALPIPLTPQWRPEREMAGRILRIALPASMERVSINLGQIVFACMVASLGTHTLAAHHLAITVESLGYMPGFGFSVAAATLVGQNLGAGDYQRARHFGLRAIGTGTLLMTGSGILMFFFADWLIALFTPDPTVRQIGAMLIRICAIEQPFSALSIIAPGALRGAGDTVAPFRVALLSMWGVRLVLAWLLGTVAGLGIRGIWYAMVIDLGVRGILLLLRFLRGGWQHTRV